MIDGAGGYAKMIGNTLHIGVNVQDAKLRETRPGFDGLEHAFALVPERDGFDGQVKWARKELGTYESFNFGAADRMTFLDFHSLTFTPGQYDSALVSRLGVAFGLETNVGLLWLQRPDGNVRPKQPEFSGGIHFDKNTR